MKTIDPGKFRHRVAIEQLVATQDAIGNEVESWAPYLDAWAAVSDLYGDEYWVAAAQGQQDTVTFTLRWCAALGKAAADKDLTHYRLLLHGVPYGIKHYDNVEYANKIMKIKAVSQ